jgi:Carboxypeptidase regulatory-like domain/TonB dependent receptor-like, beta-barrel
VHSNSTVLLALDFSARIQADCLPYEYPGRENIVMRKRFFRVLGATCVLFSSHVLALPVPKPSNEELAQSYPEQARTGVISGTVVDPSGSAIASANVTLVHAGGTSYANTKTDGLGSFRMEAVPAGAYILTIDAEGFQPLQRGLNVTRKPLAPIRLSLAILTEKQIVTVNADQAAPVVSTEASDNQNANTVDRGALDRLPVFDQDYIATLSRFLDDNIISTNGITLVVNGVEANGPGVTASAIQDVKINQNPYSALFSRPGRARLEIVTKEGTRDFHGTVNFMFRDAVFDATNKFATAKPAERRQYYEGSLTGPLSYDGKTTFLVSLDQDMDDQQTIVNAIGPTDATVGVITPIVPIHENVPAPMHHFFGSGRVFHDLANGDQFWIGYSYEHQTFKNQNVGGTVLPEAGYNAKMQEHEINVSYRHVFSPHLVNQLRFLIGHFDRPTTSVNENPQIIISGSFVGGGAQADSKRTEYHFDGTDLVSYSRGKHTLNFGIDVPDVSRRGEDDFTNQAGSYTFGSLGDYQAGHPSTYLVQSGHGHLVFLEKVLCGFIEDNIRLKPNFSVTLGLRYYWQNFFHDDPNNFAPRFGFAYAPTKASKIVIRGGAGVFFDRSGPRPIADLLHFDGRHLLRFILQNPPFPVTPVDMAGVPTSIVTLDPRAGIPYTVQYSAGIERQITAKSTLSASYVGSRGIDLFRSIDANAPPPPSYSARPDPNLGQHREMQSEGYLKSNALEITFRGSPTKFLTGQMQYTLSKTENNTSGITFFPGNSYNPSADWGLADSDRRHKFDLLGTAQAGRFFVFGAAVSLYSGKPVNITTGSDNNHDGIINDRPPGLSRNTMPGPSLINLDLTVAHDFLLSKSPEHAKKFTVSLNSFNVLNHPNDSTYVGVISSPFFHQAVLAQPPRRMQLDVQFKF